jgi:hypothetical protein
MSEKKYDNKNSFVLFPNKSVNPKAPAYTGTYTDGNGKEWEISAWEKTSRNGGTFLSGKISEKRNKDFTPKPKQNYDYREDIDF